MSNNYNSVGELQSKDRLHLDMASCECFATPNSQIEKKKKTVKDEQMLGNT